LKNLGKGDGILSTKTNLKSNPDPKIKPLRLKFLILDFIKDLIIFEIFRILVVKMSSHEMTISGVKLKFPKKPYPCQISMMQQVFPL